MNSKCCVKSFLLFCLFFLNLPSAILPQTTSADQGALLEIPENDEARRKMREIILSEASLAFKFSNTLIRQQESGDKIRFNLVENTDSYHYLFLNPTPQDQYPLSYWGNVSIKKSKPAGQFLYLTLMLRDNADSYLRIYPLAERSTMDIYLAGYRMYTNVNLAAPFERLLTASLTRIRELSRGLVDWDLVLHSRQTRGDRQLEQTAEAIRKMLPRLKDTEDGGFDEQGQPVYIADQSSQGTSGGLNCSGFSKWVVDNFYFSLQGSWLPLGRLKERLLAVRGNRWNEKYEELRDPYFGLDWTRNLAALLYEGEKGRPVTDYEAFDVRNVAYFKYIEDVGYPVEELNLLLYVLAVQRPGSFYLASVNGEFGRKPVLWQHFHVVVLFPYFSATGDFRTAVFERNLESSVDSLVKRYPLNHIHLVEIDTELDFVADSLLKLQKP